MPTYGMYPAYLVEKFGFEKVQKMINPNIVRNHDRVSKSKTAKEKVLAFVESHDRFRVWMCARGCSERTSVVLPFLIALPNLQVASDGLCTKTSRSNGTKKATKKGDR